MYDVHRDGKDVGSKALSVFESVYVELDKMSSYMPKTLDHPVWADLYENGDGSVTAIVIDPIAVSKTWHITTEITDPEEMTKAHRYLEAQLKRKRLPNSWDELKRMWHDDLYNKQSYEDWLKANWNVPTPRSL